MDSPSLEQIYKDYYQKVTFLVMKKVQDKSVVEDLVSDIFLKIANNLERFDSSKASIGTWVYTVANRYILDYYRTRKVYEAMPSESGAEGVMPDTLVDYTEPDSEMLMEEQLEALADAMEHLKQKERDVIILHYYKEMTLKQVAETMRMSYPNAKILHKKALGKLQMYINGVRPH